MKKYLVSYPIVMGCLAFAITFYFSHYRLQQDVNAQYPLTPDAPLPLAAKIRRMLPSTGYSVLVIPVKLIYKKLATFLTDYGSLEG